MTPLDVACPHCAQQPNEPCRSGDALIGYTVLDYFHEERRDAANFISNPSTEVTKDTPTTNEFATALNMTGLL